MSDNVYHPSHYTDGGIETIEYIRAKLTDEQFIGYCHGNAVKYVSRSGKKGDPIEDNLKAIRYLQWENEKWAEIQNKTKSQIDAEIEVCLKQKKGESKHED